MTSEPDLAAALDLLGRHDVVQAMVEGGATLHGGLLAAGLVDHVIAYVAPKVLGPSGVAAFPHPGSSRCGKCHESMTGRCLRCGRRAPTQAPG